MKILILLLFVNDVIRATVEASDNRQILFNRHFEARPQLAAVPVVDHGQPFVLFWYPLHPLVQIDAANNNPNLFHHFYYLYKKY